MGAILESLNNWAQEVKSTYNVNPYIFIGLYLGCAPIFWLSIVQMVRSLAKKNVDKIIKWAIVLGITILLPLVYVAIFGRNLPTWFWFVLVGFLILSVLSTLRNIKKKFKEKQ